MSRKAKRKDDEADKPLALRAEGLADWLEDIDESAWLIRRCKLWWHRNAIVSLCIEALDALAELERKNGPHDKIRRSLNTMVMAMGGAELKWAGGGKKDD